MLKNFEFIHQDRNYGKNLLLTSYHVLRSTQCTYFLVKLYSLHVSEPVPLTSYNQRLYTMKKKHTNAKSLLLLPKPRVPLSDDPV
jgi:hypothetical protein